MAKRMRMITYELKLKNIKHMLYGKQGYTELEQDIKYYPVGMKELDNKQFLLRHFGPELLPGMENASQDCLKDLMGRGSSEEPWRYGSKGIVKDFCSRIGKKDGSSNTYPNIDVLIERNKDLFTERDWKILAVILEDYLTFIREAEADVYDRIPGLQLDALLRYVEESLAAYKRKKVTKYPAMALSWLLVGALVRTRMTELSDVLEDYREALGWAEAGTIAKEQLRETGEKESIGVSEEERSDGQEGLRAGHGRPVRVIPRCLTPIPMADHSVGLVGREAILGTIRSMLEEENRIALVSGLGGIGKTAVMQRVCNGFKEKGNYVAWIDCGSSLQEDLLPLSDALGIHDEDPDNAYRMILNALKTRLDGPLYLFMDNLVRQPDSGELGVLNSLNAHIMVTSRQKNSAFPCVDLDVLGQEDALTMFFRYYNGDTDRRYEGPARDIVTSVGRHTLLVELLAKAAAKAGGTLEGFAERLAAQGAFGVFKRKLATAHDGNENRTIEDCVMKLYEISGLSEEQQQIMKLFSIFTPGKEIYWKAAEWAGLDMDALDELVERAWLGRNGLENNYTIHQIIKDSIARQMKNRGEVLKIEEEYNDLLEEVTDTDSYMPRHLEYTKVRERLTLAEDIAGYLAERTAGLLTSGDIPEQEEGVLVRMPALYNNIAGVFRAQGDYGKALEYYGKALAICERVLGTEHPDTATTYGNMAGVYYYQGDYGRALEYYGKDLTISERVLGTEHPDTATTYNNIAGVFRAQGDYEKALEYYGKALAISERVLGTEHPSTATTYNNMAGVFYAQGDYEKALEYYGRAAAVSERVLGKEHPSTATTYNNMAGVFRAQGDYAKAQVYYEKALEVYKMKLREAHPYTQEAKDKKESIINQIERLVYADDYKSASMEMKLLSDEFYNAGSAGKYNQVLKARFNAARNRFYAAKQQATYQKHREYLRDLEERLSRKREALSRLDNAIYYKKDQLSNLLSRPEPSYKNPNRWEIAAKRNAKESQINAAITDMQTKRLSLINEIAELQSKLNSSY